MEKAVSAAVQPERLLRELSELWVTLAKEPSGETPASDTSTGVLRACAMTLVTAAEESDDAAGISETLASLMHEHPSRVIVIRFRSGGDRDLEARVFAQCWMPFGQRRQICCEQIELLASDRSIPDLPAMVVPLAVADLPVVLWCRGARLFWLPEFAPLAQIAHKVIIDSTTSPDPRAIIADLAGRVGTGYALADLAWTRLTRWREVVSQTFENRSNLAQLPEVTEVKIALCGPTPPVSAYYMAAWLLNALDVAGAHAKLTWEPGIGEPGRFRRIEIVTRSGGLAVRIQADGSAVNVAVDHLASCSDFAESADYDLLREELSIPGRDPVFEKTLARAASLARDNA
jgi:glucose-6-phosphate dehydrogenase assembly protein OpcA